MNNIAVLKYKNVLQINMLQIVIYLGKGMSKLFKNVK